MQSQHDIAQYLSNAPMGSPIPILSQPEALVRAQLVSEDMAAIRFNLNIRTFPVPFDAKEVHVPYYELLDSDFGDDDSSHDSRTAHGSGMNWGDLLYLSKACKIGRLYIPNVWPLRMKAKLLGRQHNACIQELLWLARFKNVTSVVHEPTPFFGSRKGPDWQFKSDGQIINLEVKHRPGDWIRHVDGPRYCSAKPGIFDGIAQKFPHRNDGQLNFGAVTVVGKIDDSLRSAARYFMEKSSTVDAVFIYSESPGNGRFFHIEPEYNSFLANFFRGVDEEDQCHIGLVRHVLRISEERRNARPEDLPKFLELVDSGKC